MTVEINTPLCVVVDGEAIIIDGPGNVAIVLSSAAALETSERLRKAGLEVQIKQQA